MSTYIMKSIIPIVAIVLTVVSCDKLKPIPTNPPLFLSGYEQAFVETKSVTACYPSGSRPIMWDKDGFAAGIAPEYLRLVATKVRLKVDFKSYPTQSDVLDAFKAKKCDIAVSVKKVPERESFMDFTQPYLFVGSTMLVKQLPIQFPMRIGYGRKFGIQMLMDQLGSQVEIVEFPTDRVALDALIAGQISGVVMDDLTAHQLEKELNVRYARAGVNFYYDLSFGFQKNNQLLGDLLRKGLANMTLEERQALYSKNIDG